jgi:hypothetical protein
VRDAASAAISMHDYQKAVEWLEQGRSVIWGQLLNLRTPVDELRENHPGLANRLVSLSTSLETAGTRSNAVADHTKPQLPESIAQQPHALALERDRLLQQIRGIDGFERFLLPKPVSELSQAAKMGPVTIINISDYGCDALILLPGLVDEVIHVPLPDFTLFGAQLLANCLASIVGGPRRGARSSGFPGFLAGNIALDDIFSHSPSHNTTFDGSNEVEMAPDDIFCFVLSELWYKVVHPVLKALRITVSYLN